MEKYCLAGMHRKLRSLSRLVEVVVVGAVVEA
jgi:hypothetical protein